MVTQKWPESGSFTGSCCDAAGRGRTGIDLAPAPILSVTHGASAPNQRLGRILREAGIYPSYINYPGCPPGGHFRFTFSSAHTDADVERLLQAIAASCA